MPAGQLGQPTRGTHFVRPAVRVVSACRWAAEVPRPYMAWASGAGVGILPLAKEHRPVYCWHATGPNHSHSRSEAAFRNPINRGERTVVARCLSLVVTGSSGHICQPCRLSLTFGESSWADPERAIPCRLRGYPEDARGLKYGPPRLFAGLQGGPSVSVEPSWYPLAL